MPDSPDCNWILAIAAIDEFQMNAIHSRLAWRVKQVLNINKTAQDRFAMFGLWRLFQMLRFACKRISWRWLSANRSRNEFGSSKQAIKDCPADQWADWSFHNEPNEAETCTRSDRIGTWPKHRPESANNKCLECTLDGARCAAQDDGDGALKMAFSCERSADYTRVIRLKRREAHSARPRHNDVDGVDWKWSCPINSEWL